MGYTKKPMKSSSAATAANSATAFPAFNSAITFPAVTSSTGFPAAPPGPHEMNEEIEKSIEEMKNRDIKKATKLMDQICQRYKSYILPHIHRSDMYSGYAVAAEDRTNKIALARTAANSAAAASFLSPNNVYLRAFKVFKLYQLANIAMDAKAYDQVVNACDIALELPTADLIDPAKDSVFASNNKLTTPESRIHYCLQLIRYFKGVAICSKNRLPDLIAIDSTERNSHQADQTVDRKSNTLEYLESLSTKDRMELSKVSIVDSAEATKKEKLDMVTIEALTVVANGLSIKASPCCYCRVPPFPTPVEHKGHVFKAHVGDLAQRLRELRPEKSNKEFESVFPENASSDSIQSFITFGLSPLHIQNSSSIDASTAERAELLRQIVKVFQRLLEQKILSVKHLDFVMQLSKKYILGLQSATQPLDNGVIDSIECIRYLPASELETIFNFLQDLQMSCKVDKNEAESSADTNAIQGTHETPWLSLDHDWPILCLDIQNLGDWLYPDSRGNDEHKVVWSTTLRNSRELIEELQEKFSYLCSLCEEKLRYLDAWSNIREVEHITREHLIKRQQELLDGSNSVELGAINDAIESADTDGIRKVIDGKARGLYIEICKIDARILWTKRELNQLEQKIEQTSVYDYQIALMEFVRSFLRKRLEVRASDAAGADLLLGDKHKGLHIDKGSDRSKQGNEIPKSRRKK